MLIYRSFYEAIRLLPLQNQAEVWNAIFELGLNENEIKLEGISKTVMLLIKPQIEANIRRFKNGCKDKTKQNESKTEAKQKQSVSKVEANNNNNINTNKNNIDYRKKEFYNQLTPFILKYPKDMLREFYDYWTEIGIKDRKMRFEKEKVFGLERRLLTWYSNSKFNSDIEVKKDSLVDYVNNQINGK